MGFIYKEIAKKEKYVRRHGRAIKGFLNSVVLNPVSYATGYRLDLRFSPIEDVTAPPSRLHGRVNRVSNSMSWTEKRMFKACSRAGDDLLHDLKHRSLDFRIR